MAKKKPSYKFLLTLYWRVEEFLSSENPSADDLPDNVIAFCIVVEKIFKIKLHDKNPLLIFDTNYIRDEHSLSVIALKKEKDIDTAKIKDILNRFAIIFKNIFTPDELQALADVYELRNHFVHDYKPDDQIIFDPEDILKKMGTIWEKLFPLALALLGKENIKKYKPKKKYTELELEKVLEDEVRKMIERRANSFVVSAYGDTYNPSIFVGGDVCPRCGAYGFSQDGYRSELWSTTTAYDPITVGSVLGVAGAVNWGLDLYKCKRCNLELTKKQYEIAKRIRGMNN